MQERENLTSAESELAAALGTLRPAGVSLDRDRRMFLAGRAAGGRRNRAWQGLAVLRAAGRGVLLALRPPPREIERVVVRTVERAAPPAVTPPPLHLALLTPNQLRGHADYLKLRQEVLTKGLDALPAPRPAAAGPAEPAETIEHLLGERTRMRPRPSFFGLKNLIFGDKS